MKDKELAELINNNRYNVRTGSDKYFEIADTIDESVKESDNPKATITLAVYRLYQGYANQAWGISQIQDLLIDLYLNALEKKS